MIKLELARYIGIHCGLAAGRKVRENTKWLFKKRKKKKEKRCTCPFEEIN
jgi:hypothetical protein